MPEAKAVRADAYSKYVEHRIAKATPPIRPVRRTTAGEAEDLGLPSGRVSFDAERTSRGHADGFWALALACRNERARPARRRRDRRADGALAVATLATEGGLDKTLTASRKM